MQQTERPRAGVVGSPGRSTLPLRGRARRETDRRRPLLADASRDRESACPGRHDTPPALAITRDSAAPPATSDSGWGTGLASGTRRDEACGLQSGPDSLRTSYRRGDLRVALPALPMGPVQQPACAARRASRPATWGLQRRGCDRRVVELHQGRFFHEVSGARPGSLQRVVDGGGIAAHVAIAGEQHAILILTFARATVADPLPARSAVHWMRETSSALREGGAERSVGKGITAAPNGPRVRVRPTRRNDRPAHTVRNAAVGGIRDARTAGIRPASPPIMMAEAMPPDHASAGITTPQPFEVA
jgi:hypothetical protein